MQGALVFVGILALAMANVPIDTIDSKTVKDDVPIYEIQTKLRHDLLDSYDKTALPILTVGKPVDVKVGSMLIKSDIDEDDGVVRSDMFFVVMFKDPRLAWDVEQYQGIDQLGIPSTDVWLPDVTHFQDTRKFTGMEQLAATFGNNINVIVYSDGSVVYVPSITVETPCKLDYTQWPLDTQFCSTKFGSWIYDDRFIKLEIIDAEELMDNDRFKPVPSLTWNLEDMRLKKTDFKYKDLKFDVIDIKFVFHRKAEKFCTTLFGPIFVSILISILGFLEPSGKPVKHLMYIFNIFFIMAVTLFHVGNGVEGKPKIFGFIFGFVLVQFVIVFGDHLSKVGNCFGKKIIKVVKKFQKNDKYSQQHDDSLTDPVVIREVNEQAAKPLYTFALQGLLLGIHVTLIAALYMAYWPSKFMVIHDPQV